MGIKNLRVILNQKCKLAINTRKLESYRGMTLGIDLSIFLYKYLYNNDDHIEGLTRFILRLLKNQITPLFIFDGKPPKEKDDVLLDRKEKKQILTDKKNIVESMIHLERVSYDDFKTNVQESMKDLVSGLVINDEELKELFSKNNDELKEESYRISKKIIYVTPEHIENSKKLFELFGIKYIHAPCEAESLLALLCKNNVVDGCISEDTDVLVNGGHLFLRNFNADKNTIDEYCLHGILDGLEMTFEQFIDMCILCGCDYTTKINGMGPITAYKLIKKHNNLESVLENNTKFIIPENFDYKKARDLFKNPITSELYDSIDKNVKISEPNISEIKVFLKESKLKDKFFKEIDANLMNYYININGVYDYDNTKVKSKKITDFFSFTQLIK